MIHFTYKKTYLKSFDLLSRHEQSLAVVSDEEIRSFYETGHAPHGLGIKKLYSGNGEVFEARISLSLRIIWVRKKSEVIFTLVGDHGTVRKYIRNL